MKLNKFIRVFVNDFLCFDLKTPHPICILRGDSGTGKTLLDYVAQEQHSSLIRIESDIPVRSLSTADWPNLEEGVTYIVDEFCPHRKSSTFYATLSRYDNQYLFLDRRPNHNLSVHWRAIYELVKTDEGVIQNEQMYFLGPPHGKYDIVLVEDRGAGAAFFTKVINLAPVVVKMDGKDQILKYLKRYVGMGKSILVIADGCAVGSQMKALTKFLAYDMVEPVSLFLPESFEYLLLSSNIFKNNVNVQQVLQDPYSHYSPKLHATVEKMYAALLDAEMPTHTCEPSVPNARYTKGTLPPCFALNCCYNPNVKACAGMTKDLFKKRVMAKAVSDAFNTFYKE